MRPPVVAIFSWVLLIGTAVVVAADMPATIPASTIPASGPAAEVPDAVLARLRAKYIPADQATADPTGTDKVRRYESILREGAWTEKQYPRASNLHQVRTLMLFAAKGLVTLTGNEDSRAQLEALARRLAESDAPPEARVPADLLVTRAQLDQLADAAEPAGREKLIAAFVARYAGTTVEPQVLMCAVEFCELAEGGQQLRSKFLGTLRGKHAEAPGVTDFLRTNGESPDTGRPLVQTLTLLDGSKLVLPRDILGRVTLLHFWSTSTGLLPSSHYTLQGIYGQQRSLGMEIVDVSLDLDREKVSTYLKNQKGANWFHAFSGQGPNDPTYLRYRLPFLPCSWIIGPDGRILSATKDMYPGVLWRYTNPARAAVARLPYYRSGEFLLDLPEFFPAISARPGDPSVQAMEIARQKVCVEPALGLTREQKAERFKEVLQFAEAAEKTAAPADLTVLRNQMLVAARWLAAETRDKASIRQSRELAEKVRGSKVSAEQRLLAEYVCAAGELADKELFREKASARIEEFVRPYVDTPAQWAAEILGVILAAECGEEQVQAKLVESLRQASLKRPPRLRWFLRDFHDGMRVFGKRQDVYTGKGETIKAALPRLDGQMLRLPDDLRGKVVVIQFWSMARPPEPPDFPGSRITRDDVTPDPADRVIVGFNMDRSRSDVEKFLKDKYPGWIHVFTGKGREDPLVRDLDVFELPRTLVLDREGRIVDWGTPGLVGHAMKSVREKR